MKAGQFGIITFRKKEGHRYTITASSPPNIVGEELCGQFSFPAGDVFGRHGPTGPTIERRFALQPGEALAYIVGSVHGHEYWYALKNPPDGPAEALDAETGP